MKKFLFMLMALVCTVTIQAQTKTVRGTVSSEDGEPIVGASLLVEGTNLGSMSDIDGHFLIQNVPADAKYLRVSYVGMSPQQVAISNKEMQIVLRVNSELLDEVVVTAMGISRSERSLGYAATQVGAAEIEQAQTSNVMNALQGKVAGLQILNMGSAPGSANNVQIRGIGSVSGNNQPLYVVDGVPLETKTLSTNGQNLSTGGISNIAPDDIASLTVLKGAAATALYGSRAANGVIIVTTKSGGEKNASGKNFQIVYSGNVEGSRVGYLPEMQNSWGQGWNGSQTYIENGSWGPVLNGSLQPYGPVYNGQQLIAPFAAVKSNVRDFFDTGWSQNHNVSISGNSNDNKMTYYASYSYTGIDGVIPTNQDSYRRNTISLRGSYQPVKWIKFSTAMNLATYKTKAVSSYQGVSVIDGIYELPRNISTSYMKDLDNPFNTPEAYLTPYGITNPYWALENNINEINGKQTYGKLQVDIFPVNGLTLTYRFGFDYTDYDSKLGEPQIGLTDALVDQDFGYPPSSMNQDGYVYARYSRGYELNHDFLANYTNKFVEDKLDLGATIGFNINERGNTLMYGQADNLGIYTGFWDLSNGATWSSLAESQWKRRLVGIFGDVTLGWDDFIYLDISARNDWSSTLPINKNSFFYPGVTLSGIFTRWIESDVLTFGKVRLAYGRTGSDAGVYETMTNFIQAYAGGYYISSAISFPVNSVNAFMASATSGAKTLRPEMTDEFEVGANLRFFGGRIDIDASYYNRVTKDQIFTLPTDPASGFSYQVVNFGKVRNRGVELVANFIPMQTKDWQWTIGFNWSKNCNKVLSLPEGMGGKTSIYGFTAGNDNVTAYAEVGKPIGEFYTYLPSRVEDENSPYYGSLIVDRYGQPVVNTGDGVQDTGFNMQYDWTGGVTTAITWKGLTLSAAFDFRQGGHMFSRTKNLMQFTGNGVVTSYNDRNPFIIPGSVVANADGSYSPNTTPIYVSDGGLQNYYDTGYGNAGLAYLIDRSFTKIRNLSLTWSLPYKWVHACCLQGIDITVYGNNLFMWTAKGNYYIDPETSTISSGSYGDIATQFGELYTNPSPRSIGLNLKVTF